MATAGAAQRPRRTQEERSAETRRRLLEATIECLVEFGYARTSAPLIAKRAGVSRGAQSHQYPTRVDLLTAAIEYLGSKQTEEMRAAVARVRPRDRMARFLDMMGDTFEGPLFIAWCEVWIAARTDPDLLRSLRPMNDRLGHLIVDFWHEFFDETGIPSSRVHFVMHMSTAFLRGLAMEELIRTDERHRRTLIREWARIVENVLYEGVENRPRPARRAS